MGTMYDAAIDLPGDEGDLPPLISSEPTPPIAMNYNLNSESATAREPYLATTASITATTPFSSSSSRSSNSVSRRAQSPLAPDFAKKQRTLPPYLLKSLKVAPQALKRPLTMDEEGRICILNLRDEAMPVPMMFAATGTHDHWTYTAPDLYDMVEKNETFRVSRVPLEGLTTWCFIKRADCYNEPERKRIEDAHPEIDMGEVVHKFWCGAELPKTQKYFYIISTIEHDPQKLVVVQDPQEFYSHRYRRCRLDAQSAIEKSLIDKSNENRNREMQEQLSAAGFAERYQVEMCLARENVTRKRSNTAVWAGASNRCPVM